MPLIGKLIKMALEIIHENKSLNKLVSIMNFALERAPIEGINKKTYEYRAIEDILYKCEHKKYQQAARELAKVKKNLLPFDVEYFFELYQPTEKLSKCLKDENVWVFLGGTGAGAYNFFFFSRSNSCNQMQTIN